MGRIQETAQAEAARGWEFQLAWDLPQRRVWVTCWGVFVGVELQGGLNPRLKHYEAAGAGQRGPSGGRVPSPSSTAPRSEPGHLSEAGEVRAAFLPCGLGSPACGLRIVASPYSFRVSVRIPCMENTGKGLLSSWPRWGRGGHGDPQGLVGC